MGRLTPYLFLLPALILLSIFSFYPLIQTVYISFFDFQRSITDVVNLQGDFVAFENYQKLFSATRFFNPGLSLLEGPPFGALIHNIIWVVIMVPLTMVLGLTLAILLRRMREGYIIRSMIFLGMVTPLIVGGLMLLFIYHKDAGVGNALLRLVGLGFLARSWTIFPDTALYALILGSVWIWTGFPMIIYSAGLEGIPDELHEAARIDGASGFQVVRYVTIPMLRPATITSLILTTLTAFKILDIVVAVRGFAGGPGDSTQVLALLMYAEGFQNFNYGGSAAISVFLT
ncbi:MAG: carbohydrate ABC transporter permease, partial [Candidatus Geothermarchaeales archaeon]